MAVRRYSESGLSYSDGGLGWFATDGGKRLGDVYFSNATKVWVADPYTRIPRRVFDTWEEAVAWLETEEGLVTGFDVHWRVVL